MKPKQQIDGGRHRRGDAGQLERLLERFEV
jgi:hypothetical protein